MKLVCEGVYNYLFRKLVSGSLPPLGDRCCACARAEEEDTGVARAQSTAAPQPGSGSCTTKGRRRRICTLIE
jgi:hypothetical protein